MNSILKELYEHFEKKGIHNIQCILQNYMDDCGIGTLLKNFKLHVKIIHFLFNLLYLHIMAYTSNCQNLSSCNHKWTS